MPIRPYRQINQKGFTLAELMVGLGLSGVVFLIMMTLMGQTAKFAAFFNGTATSIEGVSDAVSQLNAIMPQVVRIGACNCRGSGALQSRSNCRWDDANPWYNPVLNGGATNTGNSGHGVMLLSGEFESFFGGANTANTTQLLTSNVGTFASGLGGCNTYTGIPVAQRRGCKMNFALYYKAPIRETAGSAFSNASLAGSLTLKIGDTALVAAPGTGDAAPAASVGQVMIGRSHMNGAGGLGITELSCGFHDSAGGGAGLLFALNFKIKARGTTILNPSMTNYESWYPTVNATNGYSGTSGKNYELGLSREVKLKYALRNIGTRGLYHWRSSSTKECRENGATGITNKEQCCSMAMNGGACVACIAGGLAGTVNSCCSERLHNVTGLCR